MNVTLHSLTYGPVLLQPAVTIPFGGYTAPGSKSHYTKGKFGNIMFREINAGGCTLFCNDFNMQEDLALDITITSPVLLTSLALKNENRFKINRVKNICIEQGQFNTIFSSSAKSTLYLEKNKEYRSFGIYYHEGQLPELLSLFPNISRLIMEADPAMPGQLFKDHQTADAQVFTLVNQLLYCNYTGNLRKLYFEYKIKELFFLLLSPEHLWPNVCVELSDPAIESVNEARHIIETGFEEDFSLHKIAERVGLDEIKLLRIFKLLFGIEMFEYLLQTNIQKKGIPYP